MKPRLTTLTILVIGIAVAILGTYSKWREFAHAALSQFAPRLTGAPAPYQGVQEPPASHRHVQPEGPSARLSPASSEPSVSATRGASIAGLAPEGILQRAIELLERSTSVAAKTRQAVDLCGKRLVGSGEYLEQRVGGRLMLRLELKIQLADEPTVLLQVCDGRYLWRAESYRGKGTAERVDLARVAQALEGREEVFQPGRLGIWPGLGGLPKLLRALHAGFAFDSAQETTLPDRTPVIGLEGRWRAQALAALVPNASSSSTTADPADLGKLPEHLPHRVLLYLGREDLFPFRIEYRRRGARLPGGIDLGEDRPIVTMDLFEVTHNVSLNPARFEFSPGDLKYVEGTDRFLQQLGLSKR